MKAILLAAGRGSRLGNLTETQPKCLAILQGKTLLEWQLLALRGAGVQEIGIVVGYRAEQLAPAGVTRFTNARWSQTNMFQSVCCAHEWLTNDTCIVSYSDIVYPAGHVERLLRSGGEIAITYDREWRTLWKARFDDPLADVETFRIDNSGVLVEIGAKAETLEEVQGQYMGLLKFTPTGWGVAEQYALQLDPAQRDRLDMTSLLRGLMRSGVVIHTVPVDGRWCEVDNAGDLDLYNAWPEPLF